MQRLLPLTLTLLITSQLVLAEPPKDPHKDLLYGEIKLEAEDKQVSPYEEGQTGAISLMQELSEFTQLKTNKFTGANSTKASTILHLNALYLVCTQKKGTCQEVLDSVLEVDVINSKVSGTPACPTMLAFLKSWVKNDMDKRLSYKMRTGDVAIRSEFQKNKLPRYINCLDTIKQETNSTLPADEFFKARYGQNAQIPTAVGITLKHLLTAKSKNMNLLTIAGLKPPAEKETAKPKKSGGQKSPARGSSKSAPSRNKH